jgi:hypothetical protein
MSDKVLIVIATGDPAKALVGVTYALRTLQEGWLDDVKLVFFGPGQDVLLTSSAIQDMVVQIGEVARPLACKAVADRNGTVESTERLGVEVAYVGKLISDMIRQGYAPMVW